MTSLKFDPFDEFQKFLEEISFKDLTKNADYLATSNIIHKRVLALLIVEFQLSIELQKSTSELTKATTSYLQEFRSDILSAMMIFHMGLYKAAIMSARSAAENLFRVATGIQGVDFRSLKSVYELVDLVKQSSLYKSKESFKTPADTAIQKYGDFCNYVHSSGEDYLTLDRQLSGLPRWEKATGSMCGESLLKLIQAAITILLVLKPEALHMLRHDHKDFVLDALPMGIKKKLAQEL